MSRLWPEKMQENSADAIGLKRPDDPEDKKDRRHGGGHVEIGVAAAQQRAIDMKNAGGRIGCPQPIVPTPGIKPTQLANKMKMKMVAKNQKVFLHQIRVR